MQQYPYFVRLFQTSTPLRSVELRMKKESRDLVASAGHLWKKGDAQQTCEQVQFSFRFVNNIPVGNF